MSKKVKTSAQINHPGASKQQLVKKMSANLSGKKKLLCVHAGPANMARMVNSNFKPDEWDEVWLSPTPGFNPDIINHPTSMTSVADNSMDAVWSPHTLKHLYSHEILPTFKEFLRVIKMDASILLFTPDLETVCETISRRGVEKVLYTASGGKVTGLDVLYGSQQLLKEGALDAIPKTGFTAGHLGKLLLEAGFRDIMIKHDNWNLWAKAHKREKHTKDNKIIKITGTDVNARMFKRDHLEKEPEKPVNVDFPFKL